MKIRYAEFTKSAVLKKDYPKDLLPEIALIGRSNVGKSSLINKLINRKTLAKTSNTPGKTRTINFYLINKSFYLVDLPGYGYAKAGKAERRSWQKMIEDYLTTRENLYGALVILDVRRDPGKFEEEIFKWFEELGIPTNTIITKADKLSNNALSKRTKAIKKALKLDQTTTFSAASGLGKDEVLNKLDKVINSRKK